MLKTGTDYSGLGSPEAALNAIGVEHEITFACEKDEFARRSYLANHNPQTFYNDVQTRDNKTAPYVDLYVFGFPCQAFSIAGGRMGFEDTRGTLFFNSLEYIGLQRPRIFIAENVKGLLSHDKPPKSKSKTGQTFNTIIDSLAISVNGQYNLHAKIDCVGYHVFWRVLNSTDYGIPQNRERVFIIGFRDEEDSRNFSFPLRTKLTTRVLDLLEENVAEKYFLSDTAVKRLLRKDDFKPQINPDVSGTLNTKNNSGQLSFDNGTTLIVTNNNGELVESNVVNCLDANYHKGMDNHQQRSMVLLSKSVRSEEGKSIRRENLKNGKDYNPHRAKDVVFEERDTAATITTALTDDHLLLFVNPVADPQIKLLPLFGTEENNQSTRVYDPQGASQTLASTGGGQGAKTGLYLIENRIRRLTPRECFRLQGFDDGFFDNVAGLQSDTQLYKQAGNSMTKHTVMGVIYQALKAAKITA